MLVKSAVFQYEFEFIHPFSDGNGRMGRMRHSLLLGSWKELFYWLPVEELIQSRRKNITMRREGLTMKVNVLVLWSLCWR